MDSVLCNTSSEGNFEWEVLPTLHSILRRTVVIASVLTQPRWYIHGRNIVSAFLSQIWCILWYVCCMYLHVYHTGQRHYTFNVHQLLHIADAVRNLGPLWAHSAFPFEDTNGWLGDLFHGTRNPHKQVNVVYKLSLAWLASIGCTKNRRQWTLTCSGLQLAKQLDSREGTVGVVIAEVAGFTPSKGVACWFIWSHAPTACSQHACATTGGERSEPPACNKFTSINSLWY